MQISLKYSLSIFKFGRLKSYFNIINWCYVYCACKHLSSTLRLTNFFFSYYIYIERFNRVSLQLNCNYLVFHLINLTIIKSINYSSKCKFLFFLLLFQWKKCFICKVSPLQIILPLTDFFSFHICLHLYLVFNFVLFIHLI